MKLEKNFIDRTSFVPSDQLGLNSIKKNYENSDISENVPKFSSCVTIKNF